MLLSALLLMNICLIVDIESCRVPPRAWHEQVYFCHFFLCFCFGKQRKEGGASLLARSLLSRVLLSLSQSDRRCQRFRDLLRYWNSPERECPLLVLVRVRPIPRPATTAAPEMRFLRRFSDRMSMRQKYIQGDNFGQTKNSC